MNVREHDPALYALIDECLQGNFVSPVLHQPDGTMLNGMRHSLAALAVREPCMCGELCRSFSTTNICQDDSPSVMVRFDVYGELVLTCDMNGVIYYVERLFENAGAPLVATVERFTLMSGDWVKRTIAGARAGRAC